MTKAMKWVIIIGVIFVALIAIAAMSSTGGTTEATPTATTPDTTVTTTTAVATTTTALATTTTAFDDYCVVNGFDLYEQAVSFESSISLVSRDVVCDTVFTMLESAEYAAELDEDAWPVLCTTLVDAGVEGWLSTAPVQDEALARRTVNAVLFAAYFAAPYGSDVESFLFDCGST